jgi:hypothetical protein
MSLYLPLNKVTVTVMLCLSCVKVVYVNIYVEIFTVFSCCTLLAQSRDSSVGITLGYGLDDRGSRVRFPAGAGNFSLHHRVHNGSGADPASYPVDTRGFFPGGKAAGA